MAKLKSAERLERIRKTASTLAEEMRLLHQEFALFPDTNQMANIASGVCFYSEVCRFEMRLIRTALEVTGNNQKRAARLLGLGPSTINNKIKAYGILKSDNAT